MYEHLLWMCCLRTDRSLLEWEESIFNLKADLFIQRASFVLLPHTDNINLDADMRLLITCVYSHTHTNKVASAIPSQHTHRHTVVWPNWFIAYNTKAHKRSTPSDFSGLISSFEKQPIPSGWNEPHTLILKPHFTSLQLPKNPPFLKTKNTYLTILLNRVVQWNGTLYERI